MMAALFAFAKSLLPIDLGGLEPQLCAKTRTGYQRCSSKVVEPRFAIV